MSEPNGEIVLSITGRDIWEKLDRIESSVSGLPAKVDDHETRIRILEARKSISPAQLWTAVVTGLGSIATSLAILNNILN